MAKAENGVTAVKTQILGTAVASFFKYTAMFLDELEDRVAFFAVE